MSDDNVEMMALEHREKLKDEIENKEASIELDPEAENRRSRLRDHVSWVQSTDLSIINIHAH